MSSNYTRTMQKFAYKRMGEAVGVGHGATLANLYISVLANCLPFISSWGGLLASCAPGGAPCAVRALCLRCARAVRKVGCFPPPVATGPRVLNSAPPMLF